MTEATPHIGAWTVDDLDSLPDDGQRYEIVDGSLLVSPAPAPKHQVIAGRLAEVLRGAAPAGLDAVEATGLEVHSGRLFIPDVLVARSAALFADKKNLAPADVLHVVEVVSPSHPALDRVAKPAYYAEAGIGSMWLVEQTETQVELIALQLSGGSYTEVARSIGGRLRLESPYPLELNLVALIRPR